MKGNKVKVKYDFFSFFTNNICIKCKLKMPSGNFFNTFKGHKSLILKVKHLLYCVMSLRIMYAKSSSRYLLHLLCTDRH
jgi:hypothetical protein